MARILQIIDSLRPGGAERMAVNMANAFSENGIANVLCVTRAAGSLQSFLDKRTACYVLHKKHAADIVAFIRLLRIIYKHKPDIIHAHSSSYFWGILAKMYCKNARLIWHNHRGLKEKAKMNARPVLSFLSRRINGIIVVNEELKGWNIENTSVPEKNIRFIKNFPDLRFYKKEKKTVHEINILCLANLRPEKDHTMLLQAFAKTIALHPEKKMNLWLAGSSEDSSYDKKLKDEAHRLGISDRIIFWGVVQDTAKLLSTAHIGVLSSYFEGLPVSLLEYGLAALPVLVTDVGQCRDVLAEGKCGWLTKPRDADEFAKALSYMINHGQECVEKGNLLKERVTKEYGGDKFVREYLSFLNSLSLQEEVPEQQVRIKKLIPKNSSFN